MQQLILALFIVLSISSSSVLAQENYDQKDFREKLSKLYKNISDSMKVLREQIIQNQSAPFLPNLYLELGGLLNQKANALYYIKKEKGEDLGEKSKGLQEILGLTKEAIEIYQKILDEHPTFNQKSSVYYALAVSYKSIDSNPGFLKYANLLTSQFGDTHESDKVKLLLGQDLFKKEIFDEALKTFKSVENSKHPFEKYKAKNYLGLIYLAQNNFKGALDAFQEVVSAKELGEEKEEFEISIDRSSLRKNLRKEALVDSTRAFTSYFKENPKPVEYYSSFVPSEQLFQEVLEKLAYRYVKLNQFDEAIKLLRVLAERLSSPEKIVQIYRDVLVKIPLEDRVLLPTEEIHFVIRKYKEWIEYFSPADEVKNSAYDFFEKQLRDLATRSHDIAKKDEIKTPVKEDPKKPVVSEKPNKPTMTKADYLQKAERLYQIYITHFPKSKLKIKMALNLADVYFRQENYLKCGEYYKRIYDGEFGKFKEQPKALTSSIFCLGKDKDYGFYELRRVKGLLISTLTTLQKVDPKKKNDPKTNFYLAKAIFDQGFYDKGIPKLYEFTKKFPQSEFSIKAANIILDHYNIKDDYNELIAWSKKLGAVNFGDKSFKDKLSNITKQAQLKLLKSEVEKTSSMDGFVTSSDYLKSAVQLSNPELQSIALQTALTSSKRDKDIETFFKTSNILADKNKNQNEKFEIRSLVAREHMRIGQYSSGLKEYKSILNSAEFSPTQKKTLFTEYLSFVLIMRDISELIGLMNSSLWGGVSGELKDKTKDLFISMLSSPIAISSPVKSVLGNQIPVTDDLVLGVNKAEGFLGTDFVKGISDSRCQESNVNPGCGLYTLKKYLPSVAKFITTLKSGPFTLDALQIHAPKFEQFTNKISKYEGRDPSLDMLLSSVNGNIFNAFGEFIGKIAQKSSDMRDILMAKRDESFQNSKSLKNRCLEIAKSAQVINPYKETCKNYAEITKQKILTWKKNYSINSIPSIPDSNLMNEKKDVFSEAVPGSALTLATKYLSTSPNHALLISIQNLSNSSEDKSSHMTIVGCALNQLGYLSESLYYLSQGNKSLPLTQQCLGRF